jgi:hypothetical protein
VCIVCVCSYSTLTHLAVSGLSFSKCHAVRRVPYDPNLKQVFGRLGEVVRMFVFACV